MQWVNVTENRVSPGSIAQALLFKNDNIRTLEPESFENVECYDTCSDESCVFLSLVKEKYIKKCFCPEFMIRYVFISKKKKKILDSGLKERSGNLQKSSHHPTLQFKNCSSSSLWIIENKYKCSWETRHI